MEWLAYCVADRLTLRLQQPSPAGLAVLCNFQLLGDYALWSPYAKACATQWRQQGLKVALVCNEAWANLAENDIDPDVTIGIDLHRFLRNLAYRRTTLRTLRGLGAQIAVCAVHPRDGIVSDACMRAIAAPRSFGFLDTYNDRSRLDARMSQNAYSTLVTTLPGAPRVQAHARLLRAAGLEPPQGRPSNGPSEAPHPETPNASYLVVSPCTSRPEKTWPAGRFVEVAQRALAAYPSLHCVLVGAPGEREQIEIMRSAIGDRAVNLAGRNSLIQLRACIRDACAVLGNDSAAIHFAAVCGVPSVVAMNGSQYGYCHPYPMAPADPVFPVPPVLAMKHMDCYGCDWNCRYRIGRGGRFPCLDAVDVSRVWEPLRSILAGCDLDQQV